LKPQHHSLVIILVLMRSNSPTTKLSSNFSYFSFTWRRQV